MTVYRVTLYTGDCRGHRMKVTSAAYHSIRRTLADIRGAQDTRRLQIATNRGIIFDQPLSNLLPILEWERLPK